MRLLDRTIDILRNEGLQGAWRRSLNKVIYNYHKLTFRPYWIKKLICGEEVNLLIGDLCARDWYDRPHEWPELMWLKEFMIKADDIVVDCGAHQGLTTILFSRWAAEGQVFGYEAHPLNAKIANTNLSDNHIKNGKIRHCAVGHYIGKAVISDHSNSALINGKEKVGIDVPIVTLDSEFASGSPTFIKIDVEGQELNVLKGASQILKTKPKLDIEIHCCLFTDPVNEIQNIFDIISIKDYEAFIQFEVDGPIHDFNLTRHTSKYLSQFEVVHLFCLPHRA